MSQLTQLSYRNITGSNHFIMLMTMQVEGVWQLVPGGAEVNEEGRHDH